MVAITYSGARAAAPAVARKKAVKQGKGFFARMVDAIAASQMQRAARELANHRHLLPLDFQLNAPKVWSRNEDEPRGGW